MDGNRIASGKRMEGNAMEEEIEKERRGEGADRRGSPWRRRRGSLPVHAMAARSASDDDVLDGSGSERRRGEEERIW